MPLKRIIISISALLIVIAVALGGNHIVASALDARLAPLLTRVLGMGTIEEVFQRITGVLQIRSDS